jgi:hypothetical protein
MNNQQTNPSNPIQTTNKTKEIPMNINQTNLAPTSTAAVPTPNDFKSAYEALRARLEQKAAGDLGQFSLEGALVVQTLLGVYQEVEQHREAILQECPKLSPNIFPELKQAIFALGHAESLKRGAPGLPSDLEDPIKQVRDTRTTMKADLEPLVVRGLLAEDALTLSQGNSARNIAFDVLRFANYMDQHATILQGRMWTTPEELSKARAAAQELLEFAGSKDQATAEDEVALMQQRAMNHAAELYEELRWAVRYARRKLGDADTIAPSLYTMRAQRGATKGRPLPEGSAPNPSSAQTGGGVAVVDVSHLEAIMNGRPSDGVPTNGATQGAATAAAATSASSGATANQAKSA